jgi:t-SNARE complex subunit (syntaxin)
MHFDEKDMGNLEQLLESLIKMVGKSNNNVESLQKRVAQLEWVLREQHMESREHSRIRVYSS